MAPGSGGRPRRWPRARHWRPLRRSRRCRAEPMSADHRRLRTAPAAPHRGWPARVRHWPRIGGRAAPPSVARSPQPEPSARLAAEAETDRNKAIAGWRRAPVPSPVRNRRAQRRRGWRRVKRIGEDIGAARAISSRGKSGRCEPNRRSDASKPDRTTPPAVAEATTTGQLTTGQPMAEALLEIGLAPGLYLVATPIGNLGDVTLRALAVLRGVDRIFCEDTRITAKLLARYGISTPLAVYHDHNAGQVRPVILAALHRGERVALVSDAGTPLVSDPGYKLARAAIAENLTVTAAPGPSAALTALILSGLPPDTFLFAGFLPPRQTARRRALEG